MDSYQIVYEAPHGSSVFPFSIWNSLNYSSGRVVHCNCHEDFEIIYVEKGRLCCTINLNDFVIGPGQAVFINGGDIHSGYALTEPCELYALSFGPRILRFRENDPCESQYIFPLIQGTRRFSSLPEKTNPCTAQILEDIRSIISAYYHGKTGYDLFIRASLYRIVSLLYADNALEERTVQGEDPVSGLIGRIKKVLDYIEKSYTGRIYISELARECSLSESYFIRYFKRLTGSTPVEFINTRRLQYAGSLLLDTDLSVIDISMSSGFDNISYFDKLFKKFYGCSPTVYRQRPENNHAHNMTEP